MRAIALRLVAPGLLAATVLVLVIAYVSDTDNAPVANAQIPGFTADEPSTVSAVGVGQVQATADAAGFSLSIGIQQQSSGTDVQAAVQAAQAKIAAIQAAIEAVGVPAEKIVLTNFNISPGYGPYPPVPVPVAPDANATPASPDGQAYMVNANLEVDTDSPEQLAAAMQAAIEAGATSVGTFGKGGPQAPPPDSHALTPAIQQATEQAKTMAQASAQAAGVKLGDVSSVSVQPPMGIYTGPGPSAMYWQVQVKVTYSIDR